MRLAVTHGEAVADRCPLDTQPPRPWAGDALETGRRERGLDLDLPPTSCLPSVPTAPPSTQRSHLPLGEPGFSSQTHPPPSSIYSDSAHTQGPAQISPGESSLLEGPMHKATMSTMAHGATQPDGATQPADRKPSSPCLSPSRPGRLSLCLLNLHMCLWPHWAVSF